VRRYPTGDVTGTAIRQRRTVVHTTSQIPQNTIRTLILRYCSKNVKCGEICDLWYTQAMHSYDDKNTQYRTFSGL